MARAWKFFYTTSPHFPAMGKRLPSRSHSMAEGSGIFRSFPQGEQYHVSSLPLFLYTLSLVLLLLLFVILFHCCLW